MTPTNFFSLVANLECKIWGAHFHFFFLLSLIFFFFLLFFFFLSFIHGIIVENCWRALERLNRIHCGCKRGPLLMQVGRTASSHAGSCSSSHSAASFSWLCAARTCCRDCEMAIHASKLAEPPACGRFSRRSGRSREVRAGDVVRALRRRRYRQEPRSAAAGSVGCDPGVSCGDV